jgi:hypothetical protein
LVGLETVLVLPAPVCEEAELDDEQAAPAINTRGPSVEEFGFEEPPQAATPTVTSRTTAVSNNRVGLNPMRASFHACCDDPP